MKLTFLGADREVTGSCTQLEAAGHRFLIDCGMEQGRDVYENADLPCAPGTYEALLLTHAHIDHSGRIPYLYKNGYRGPIYTTDATRDLCAIMLEDSAHIQEQEAEWKNRKAMRSGAEMIEPDYTVEDAQNVMKQFVPCPYEAWQTLFDGPTGKIEMHFTDVGHLLGSASVSLRIAEPGRTPEIIVFSGDIGNTHQPLIKDPSNPGHADYLVMESTYGDRSHGPKPDYIGDLSAVLQSTFDKGGNVVIPSFAVGRTQELLYFIRQIKAEGRIKGHENFPVFVDSPLAQIHHDLPGKLCRVLRRRSPRPGAERPEPPAVPGSARQRDERGIHGHQRRPDAQGHHLRRRHVRRGPHPPPLKI